MKIDIYTGEKLLNSAEANVLSEAITIGQLRVKNFKLLGFKDVQYKFRVNNFIYTGDDESNHIIYPID